MLALYRCGRQSAALAVYQQGRRMLAEDLGIDPAPELQRLERQILNQDVALDFGPPETPLAGAPPHDRPLRAARTRRTCLSSRAGWSGASRSFGSCGNGSRPRRPGS